MAFVKLVATSTDAAGARSSVSTSRSSSKMRSSSSSSSSSSSTYLTLYTLPYSVLSLLYPMTTPSSRYGSPQVLPFPSTGTTILETLAPTSSAPGPGGGAFGFVPTFDFGSDFGCGFGGGDGLAVPASNGHHFGLDGSRSTSSELPMWSANARAASSSVANCPKPWFRCETLHGFGRSSRARLTPKYFDSGSGSPGVSLTSKASLSLSLSLSLSESESSDSSTMGSIFKPRAPRVNGPPCCNRRASASSETGVAAAAFFLLVAIPALVAAA
eukprot:31291-Pelagococcus_subviridis.AAC.7